MKLLTNFAPKRLLIVVAHPDDADFPAGGTIAGLIAAGTQVYLHVLTGGGKGSDDPIESAAHTIALRQAEQRAAAEILGITDVFFEDFTDGELENSRDVKRAIVRIIRQVRPDTLMAWDPQFWNSIPLGIPNHPDHQAAGAAAHHAAYPLARNAASFPELGLEPHTITTLMLVTFEVKAEYFVVDVTEQFDLKRKAVDAHGSQSPGESRAMVTRWGTFFGEQVGVKYGEAFKIVTIEV